MKNFSILTLLAALLFVGCSDIFVEQESPLTNETTLPDLTADFADDGLTRTYVEAGKYLRWHEADLITAFFGNTLNRQYKFNGATGANSGTFSLVPDGELGTGNTLDAIYAIYPYDASATISDEGLISLTLPSEQSYAESSFGKGANTMVAVTESMEDTFLSFKNACGYLKLYLYNVDGATLKSVSVKGNNNEKIAGAATVAMTFGDTPEVTMSDDATTSVTLDCGEGIALGTTSETATALWIVLPETTFENGITITVTDTEGGVFEKSTSNSVAITRNDIQPMAALAVEFVAPVVKPANNEIWYTNGSTTEATTPYKTDVFGVNIVSNTYDAEKECWVIEFDGEVTNIGDEAFYDCSSLTSVTIPDSVTTIGFYAFYRCSSLTSVTIPESVTTIDEGAFEDCSSLTSVYITDIAAWCNISFGGTISNPLYYAGNLYLNNELVTDLIIPDGATKIGSYAFYGYDLLTSVTIPDSVTSIGSIAFYDCTSLTSVTIPGSVTSIGYSTFSGCTSLTSVTIPDSVTSIDDSAFKNCTSLTSVTIGNGVTSIGYGAFSNCFSLTSVYITDIAAWCNISFGDSSSNPLRYAENLYLNNELVTDLIIPDGVTSIGDRAFYGCISLTSVTIPDSVTSIGYEAFYECTSLTSVTIPDSVTKIGDYAFYDCTSLTSITIPDSVTSIGNYAFYRCTSLTSVTIGNGVTKIGYDAFSGCNSLTSVTIPDSVTKISDGAFRYCSSLKEVYCKPTTQPSGGTWMFDDNAPDRTIYVPRNSVEAYKSAVYWKNYASAIVGYDF